MKNKMHGNGLLKWNDGRVSYFGESILNIAHI